MRARLTAAFDRVLVPTGRSLSRSLPFPWCRLGAHRLWRFVSPTEADRLGDAGATLAVGGLPRRVIDGEAEALPPAFLPAPRSQGRVIMAMRGSLAGTAERAHLSRIVLVNGPERAGGE